MSDVKGIEVHDILGLSKPITKFLECISVGVGKLYEPTHIRRTAKAKAYEIETISNAVSNCLNLPVAYSDSAVSIDSKDVNDLIMRAQNRFLYQETKKQQNIESVIAGAYKIMEDEKDVAPEPVDTDWIIRFFNSVEDISNADLQKLWSQVLAGEVKKPKSFSMRTLDTLRSISKDEALLFERICKSRICFEIDDCSIYRDNKFLEQQGIEYDDILILDECGLVNSSTVINAQTSVSQTPDGIFRNKSMVACGMAQSNRTVYVEMPHHPFSAVGNEIAKLFDDMLGDEIFLRIARLLKENYKSRNVIITAHSLHKNKDGDFEYSFEEDLLA